ncbi:c-type cytochrome [Myxococcus sp. SDU36]|uniref:c-type cytochrome n=1 Tax=Myxococcus sp. SDU36 TaxID=2831967 RepID=UPI00254296FC|nr:c-type cytochrome [Myxococcus sp. SDU36]WIG94435.1 c-type cytochrome [Myxococcus sp. SDU36]
MKRLSLLSIILIPGLAVSATDEGKLAFEKACARCHTVTPQSHGTGKSTTASKPAPPKTRTRAIDLGPLLSQRTPEQLRTWIAAPTQVNRKTNCDTRLLPEADRDLLFTFLALSIHPPPPQREETLRKQLQQDLEARRARKQRKAQDLSRPSQGKK